MASNALTIKNNRIVQVIKSEPFVAKIATYGALPLPVARKMNDIVVQHFYDKPELLKCDEASIYSAVMWCARLNLAPGFQHCAFIPRKGKCDFELMYRGYLELLKRHGGMKDSTCNVVYEVEADDFQYTWDIGREGSPEGGLVLVHKQAIPKLLRNEEGKVTGTQDKGELVAVWCQFRMEDGGSYSMVMDREQVLRIRDEAAQHVGPKSPWVIWEEAMWRKTVIKNLAKMVPMSAELETMLNEADTLDDNAIVSSLAGKEKPSPPGINMDEVVKEASEVVTQETLAKVEEAVGSSQEAINTSPLSNKFKEHSPAPFVPPQGNEPPF